MAISVISSLITGSCYGQCSVRTDGQVVRCVGNHIVACLESAFLIVRKRYRVLLDCVVSYVLSFNPAQLACEGRHFLFYPVSVCIGQRWVCFSIGLGLCFCCHRDRCRVYFQCIASGCCHVVRVLCLYVYCDLAYIRYLRYVCAPVLSSVCAVGNCGSFCHIGVRCLSVAISVISSLITGSCYGQCSVRTDGQGSWIICHGIITLVCFSACCDSIVSYILARFTAQCIFHLICSIQSAYVCCQFRVCLAKHLALVVCCYRCRCRRNLIGSGDTSTVVAFSLNRYGDGLYVYKVFCVIAYLIVASFCQLIFLFVCDSRCPFVLISVIHYIHRIVYFCIILLTDIFCCNSNISVCDSKCNIKIIVYICKAVFA